MFAMSQAQQYAWLKDAQPGAVRQGAGARRRRAVRAGRRHVGGVGHQPARRRGAGPAVRPRQAVLPGGVRDRDRGGLAAGLLRLLRGAAAAHPAAGLALVPDPEDVVEPDQRAFPTTPSCWEGIDGTRIFTPLPAGGHVQLGAVRRELAHAARNFREKGRATRSLVPFGWGDGGGGPTREMLARAHRTADLEGSPRGGPRVTRRFFRAAEAEYAEPPVWSGELYLELHRGTYTSPGPDQAGQPAQRAPAARGRAVVGDRGRRGPVRLSRTTSWTGIWKDGAAAPVPRHPARHVDRLGPPRGGGVVRPDRR